MQNVLMGIQLPKIFTFAISETSDVYRYLYTEKDELKRSYSYIDEERSEEGVPLAIESRDKDASNIVFGMIDQTSGLSF